MDGDWNLKEKLAKRTHNNLSNAQSAAKGVIACTYLFVASFALTWGPVSWIYPPQLFPLRLRGKAVAVTTSSKWILTFFSPTLSNLPSITSNGWSTLQTLEEVEIIFQSVVKSWKTKVQYQDIKKIEQGTVVLDKAGDVVKPSVINEKNIEAVA
ncbi:hypothetical protein BDW66DRAFT_154152 [Aspergillus desertorum]